MIEQTPSEPSPIVSGGTSKKRLILSFLLVPPLTAILLLLIILFSYLNSLARSSDIKLKDLVAQVFSGLSSPYQDDRLSFLILGIDKRPNDQSLLTDTILIATINANSGNYLLFSLPRDLWIDDLKTKINALYYYGQKDQLGGGASLVTNRVSEILGLKIDHTVVLSMESIKKLVDLIGGIEVEVENDFVDHSFPLDDGSDGVITVEFKKGRSYFNGEKALRFIRSRKSEDLTEGTDEARQKRQRKVILAIKNKLLSSPILFFEPSLIGQLYTFLNQELMIEPKVDFKRMASFWRLGIKAINGHQSESEILYQGEGAILVPATDPIYKTWILKPKNNNWSLIKEYFASQLPK